MSKTELTVLMACRNGERVLPRTLDGYRRLEAPPVGWKLVIVDNGSSDATSEIIDSFRRDLPIETLREPVPGKNRALNSGISAIEGRLAVLTDDDAIPHPAFLVAWACFLKAREDYGLFGGSIEPSFEAPPPRWLLRTKETSAFMFGERDLPEGPVDADEIYGPNMAVRVSLFDCGFRFDEEIGPDALDPQYPMGSETEFCRRVASSGVKSWFAREPRVSHIVRPFQLDSAAWARRAYRTGRGRAYLMWRRGEIRAAPKLSLLDRLAQYSPIAKHRFRGLYARQLAQGFQDECTRRLGNDSGMR